MFSKTLSKQAMQIIKNYSHLPIEGRDISVPYLNNQRAKVRASLRALVGKGSVEDIVEEAKIISLRDKVNLNSLTDEQLKKFLVDNNIGLDCSAFAYYVLDAELTARGKKPLRKLIKFPFARNPFRRLLSKLRPVENTGTRTLAHELNSHEIILKDIQPGDMVIMLETGLQNNLNHVLVVHEINFLPLNEGEIKEGVFGEAAITPSTIHYSHSFKWTGDGKYNTGIKQGVIEIIDLTKNILDQKWVENGKIGDENETFLHAKMAKKVYFKRLTGL